MKKRFVILLGIVMLITILGTCLTACAPSRPDKYIQRMLASDSWKVTTLNVDETSTVDAKDGNISYNGSVSSKGKTETYTVIGKTSIETYNFKEGAWTYSVITDQSSVTELRNSLLHRNVDELKLLNMPNMKTVSKDFTTKFAKEGGKWYERNTLPDCTYVKNNELYYELSSGHKTFVFNLSCSLKVPKEALDAKKVATVN